MLARLSRGEATVGWLAAPLEISFAAVAKHLRVLEAGWIRELARFWTESLDSLGGYLDGIQNGQPTGRTSAKESDA